VTATERTAIRRRRIAPAQAEELIRDVRQLPIAYRPKHDLETIDAYTERIILTTRTAIEKFLESQLL
jgi:hypothetical protein